MCFAVFLLGTLMMWCPPHVYAVGGLHLPDVSFAYADTRPLPLLATLVLFSTPIRDTPFLISFHLFCIQSSARAFFLLLYMFMVFGSVCGAYKSDRLQTKWRHGQRVHQLRTSHQIHAKSTNTAAIWYDYMADTFGARGSTCKRYKYIEWRKIRACWCCYCVRTRRACVLAVVL